jgi:hypothetical protein
MDVRNADAAKILVLLALFIALSATSLSSALSFYSGLYDGGTITASQSLLLGAATFLAASGATALVGWRLVSHLKSTSKRPVKIFGALRI